MTLLLENARLIDPEAGTDTLGWLLVENGVIAATGEDSPLAPKVQPTTRIDCKGQALAPGIVDIGVTCPF